MCTSTSNSSLEESGEKPLGGNPSSGGGGADPITVYPFAPNPEDLRAALGEKGASLNIKRALDGANPFYSIEGAEGDFTENCQRCVTAYELRRRGYDVVALPTYSNDTLPSGREWLKPYENPKVVDVGTTSPRTTQKNLEAEMKKYGKGSRGIVIIPGHVFNVENVKGKIRYVDAQTNTVYNSNNVFSRLGRKAAQVQLVRTDNLKLTEEARQAVTPVTDTVRMLQRRNKRR